MSERAGNHGKVAMGRMEMTPWTGRMIEAIVGRGERGGGRLLLHYRWSHIYIGSVPHGTSQNLRKKASCHMHVILWGHFVTYNIHFHIPGQQGEYSTHTHIHSVLTNNCVHLQQKTGNRRLHLQAGAHYGTKEFLLFIWPMYIYVCMTAWRPHTARTTLKNDYSIWAGQ